jgi:hypothetical protein
LVYPAVYFISYERRTLEAVKTSRTPPVRGRCEWGAPVSGKMLEVEKKVVALGERF